jgi:short subunit dehydrogenase-like uncharacterized protein
VYRERWRFGSWVEAASVALLQASAPAALAIPPLRAAIARRLPPGAGPDAAVRARGFFRSTLVGWQGEATPPLVATLAADLDPGYGATARMLAAMGIGLATGAFDGAPAGVVTPAAVGGAAYVASLEAGGMRFELA